MIGWEVPWASKSWKFGRFHVLAKTCLPNAKKIETFFVRKSDSGTDKTYILSIARCL